MKNRYIALCGLFAALTAIMAQISIPIGPVPISFIHVGIFIGAGILGGKYGTISQIIYVLTGLIGLPVFAGFTGGVGRIIGPTGGYILSYILMAFIVGVLTKKTQTYSYGYMLVVMSVAYILQYIIGTCWYCYVTKTDVIAGIMVCVVPFLLGDFIKALVSAIAIKKLRSSIKFLFSV